MRNIVYKLRSSNEDFSLLVMKIFFLSPCQANDSWTDSPSCTIIDYHQPAVDDSFHLTMRIIIYDRFSVRCLPQNRRAHALEAFQMTKQG